MHAQRNDQMRLRLQLLPWGCQAYKFVTPCSLISRQKYYERSHFSWPDQIFKVFHCPESNPEHSIRLHIESSSLYSVSLPAKLCSFSVLYSKVGAIASRNISNYITCDGFTFHSTSCYTKFKYHVTTLDLIKKTKWTNDNLNAETSFTN